MAIKMASITVRFYSLWHLYLGIDTVSLEANNVKEAMAQIEERFSSQLKKQLKMRGVEVGETMQDYSVILLNGCTIRNLEQTKLGEGDILHILPPAMGG